MRFIYSKQFSYFFVFIAIAVILMFFHARGWLSPVESFAQEAPRPFVYIFSGTGNGIKSFFSLFSSVNGLNSQNAKLASQVRDLEEENATLNQYKFENEILKKELNYRSTQKIDLISGVVIGRDAAGFSQTITINAGARDGVQVGHAVLAQGAYIGKITSTDTFTSKVLLIDDPQSTVDAQIAQTQDRGILRGSSGSGLVLDMISQNAQIQQNQTVVTAGLSDQIPQGLLIGSVGELQSGKTDLLQKTTIISAVDLKNLSFVSIIK